MTSLIFMDTETTGLDPTLRRAWEIALITRHPGEPDIEWQWFIDPIDLDWANADHTSLDFGRFWDRHPHGQYLKNGGHPAEALGLHQVFRLAAVLEAVARETRDRALILGSNPSFDTATLEPRMRDHGIVPGWHYHPEDVPTLAKGWLLGRGHPLPANGKSDDYCRAVGVDPDRYERHSALGDCRLFRDVYDVVTGGAS